MDAQVYQPQEQQQEENNFLEISVISEILQTIDQIESRCKGQIGEDIVPAADTNIIPERK